MARYAFFLYDDESTFDFTDQQAIADEMKLHEEFMAAVEAAGASIVFGEALEHSSTASTVRKGSAGEKGSGEALVTDGPFADTKEALGGLYVIECPDLDVALKLAKAVPAGNVEVRPVMDVPGE